MDIVRAGADDWEAMRDIRLAMLADTPLAYLETLETAQARTDDGWRERARHHTAPGSLVLGAVPGAGEGRATAGPWAGTMSGFHRPDGAPCLAAVFVAPEHRGTDLPRRLLAGVVTWARDDDADRLLLEVHEHNPRARRFYERAGFVLTGGWTPYRLDPTTRDLEMVLDLRRP